MTTTRFASLALLILVPLGLDALEPGVDPLDPQRELASLIPDHCIGYAESPNLDELFREGLEHPLVRGFLATEFGSALTEQADASPAEMLAFADALAGTSVLEALASLTEEGLALGLAPGSAGKDGKLVLLLRGADELDTEELLHKAFDLIEAQIGQPGLLDDPQRTIRGAEFWQVGEAFVARRDSLLVLANNEGLLRDVLDLASDADARGLAGKASFANARPKPEDLLFVWADLEALDRADRAGMKKLRDAAGNPGVHALLGPAVASLASAERVAAHLRVEGTSLALELQGTGTSPATALIPGARQEGLTPLPTFASPEDVANALVYRDFGAMFEHRVALFPPESLPAFSKAITDLGLFFGGRDIGEDVLPHVSPWIRLVSRPVEFDPAVRPEIPLPAVALIAEVDDAEATGNDFVTAFQTLIGILNVDEAQKGGRMMRMSLGLEGTVQVTSARFPAPGPEDGVDLSYNLQPACALVGRHLILGTHEHLVRQLVREASGDLSRPDRARETLRLDGPAVARVVADNFEALVMDKVLKEAVTREEAEEEIGGLRLLAASLREVALETEHTGADSVALSLKLQLAEAAR